MAKSRASLEVLVLGAHPCASLAACLLHDAGVRVAISSVPQVRAADRLVQVNPALFELNDITKSLKDKLTLTAFYGLNFLGTGATASGKYEQKNVAAYVTDYAELTSAMRACVAERNISSHAPDELQIGKIDESGIEIQLDSQLHQPQLVLVSDALPEAARRALGVPMNWDVDILQNFVSLRVRAPKVKVDTKPLLPISLELEESEQIGWAHHHGEEVQLSITTSPGASLAQMRKSLQHWIAILQTHHAIDEVAIDVAKMQHTQLPLAGALTQEDVGNRTLLFGPAGGFYSAMAEDIYPNCWSATFATELAIKALKEKHVQDAMQAFRNKWGSTLGDYLRGPQQNLKFLLPLVYRNPVMCARLAESILTGESVVR